MRKILLIIAIVFLFAACQKAWYVKEEKALKEKESGVCYYLPEKSLDIKLRLIKSEFIPGPYANYAKTLLSIDNISYTGKKYYQLNSIEVSENITPDDNHKYYIIAGKTMPDINITRNGILAGLNCENIISGTEESLEYVNLDESKADPSEIDFANLQINKNKYEVIDTTYRIITEDSIKKRIPVYKTKERLKTTEHKAKDAAEFIIRIRKSRFSLEAIMEDQQLSNVDVKTLINELKELEKSYMELFTGKTINDTLVKHYSFVPDASNRKQTIILDYLDKKTGKSVNDSIRSSKLKFSVEPLMNPWNTSARRDKKYDAVALYSRQPMPVKYNISFDDKLIYSKKSNCPQMGWIRELPSSVIDKETGIRIDTETGAVIKIENKD